MHPLDRWGPFADGISQAERVARLRCLRTIAHLLLGPRGMPLKAALLRAETGEVALDHAHAAIDALPSLDRRRVLASYAAMIDR